MYNVKGEYKKVNVPVEVVLPNFNDLFVKSAAWTDDNNVTMRLNVDGNATMMTAYKTSVDLSKQELTVNFGKLNTESAVQNDKASFNANDATFKITKNVIKDHALQSVKAQSVYVLNGITGLAALTYDTQLTMTYKGTVKVGNSEVWTSIPVTVSVVNE